MSRLAWLLVLIPAGSYLPFFPARKNEAPVPVAVRSFSIDQYPVTQGEFLAFVKANREWRKSRVRPVFSDSHYLEDWKSDLDFGNARKKDSPVTRVSWFAARAYCEWKGLELPSNDQWEYAAGDQGRDKAKVTETILRWYSEPNAATLPSVKTGVKNGFGVNGLHGLVWEWTEDFNNSIAGPEARNPSGRDDNLFCGNGAQGALDPSDYASFMRYGFRSSLKATYTIANLGFRCAKEGNE